MNHKYLKGYSIWLINQVPHEAYVTMLSVFCFGGLVLFYVYGVRKGLRYSIGLLLLEYMFLLYASTVAFRSAMAVRDYKLMPFWSYYEITNGDTNGLLSENLMNVIVFVPVGVLAGVAFRGMNWTRALVIGLGLSVGIEMMQFVFRKGFSEVDDVMHNTLGCLIGFGIYRLMGRCYIK